MLFEHSMRDTFLSVTALAIYLMNGGTWFINAPIIDHNGRRWNV